MSVAPLEDLDLVELMARPEPVEEKIVIPEPLVRARPAKKSEIPGGAMQIAKKAIANGFKVKASYARGPRLDARWKFIEHSDSIVLRGWHDDGRRFVAIWISKTAQKGAHAGEVKVEFDTAYCHREIGRCNSTRLTAYLVTPHSD